MAMSIALAPSHWEARTLELPDVPNLLDLLGADGGLAWVRGTPNDQQGIVGWGEVSRIAFSGAERFSRAHRAWTEWTHLCDGATPLAFASFTFASARGESVLVVPQVAVRRDGHKTTATIVAAPGDLPSVSADLLERIERSDAREHTGYAPRWRDGAQDLDSWMTAVDTAVARINSGELDKVVLARDIVADLDRPLDIGALLSHLNTAFPDCWTFCVDGLVGSTPELLVRRNGPSVTSRVLAGTVRRSSDITRDGALRAKLLGSDKDKEEHAYAVESVAEALANHCTDLQVPSRPFVLRLANVQHLATDVSGELVDDASALVLAASLHPTAAVCGTPTERAKQVIRELEALDRSRYAGPVGWVDANGDGEFGIALRCGEVLNADRTSIRLFAGCGIVAGSTSAEEVAESDAKFAAMRNALAADN